MTALLSDEAAMRLALLVANQAAAAGEVPVGAVVVKDGQVIATGRNTSIGELDPSGHAEVVALRAAARVLGNYRLEHCTLYVTLEPCAMCCGAIFNARLARVIFGAKDARTGAAGSVLNLFDIRQLNHHTQLVDGVLAQECAHVLQAFFNARRAKSNDWLSSEFEPSSLDSRAMDSKDSASVRLKAQLHLLPRKDRDYLRPDVVRTPSAAWAGLTDYPWPARYLRDLPSLAGLRMHYLDEGSKDAPLTWLCLHGSASWSYLYRHMIPTWLAAGHRVVAPDLIGFGKSDKPKKESVHSLTLHRALLLELIERLDLQRVILVVHGWGGPLGLTLPMNAHERYYGVLLLHTQLATSDLFSNAWAKAWLTACQSRSIFEVADLRSTGQSSLSAVEAAAYQAPFPEHGYRAALRAFPSLMRELTEGDGALIANKTLDFWQHQWTGQGLLVHSQENTSLQMGLAVALAASQRLQYQIRGNPQLLHLPTADDDSQQSSAELSLMALRAMA